MASTDAGFRVLVVCTGNTCRSPMAAVALRRALGKDAERVDVVSAGTAAWDGQSAAATACEVVAGDGMDLTSHRARRVTAELVQRSDLILVMERAHLGAVQALGAPAGRVHVLSEWPAPGEPELPISDPFGASREAYEECWRRIHHHFERVVPQIQEQLRARSA